MNDCRMDPGFDPRAADQTVNRWIAGELKRAQDSVTRALEGYRFNEAADSIYHFVWGTYCDWYLELSKPFLNGDDAKAKAETQATAAWAFDGILRLMHPFMPFMTEELWGLLSDRNEMLAVAEWPEHGDDMVDPEADREIDWLIRLVQSIRSVRSEANVPAAAKIPLLLRGANEISLQRLARHKQLLLRLARLDSAEALVGEAPEGALQAVIDEATIVLPLAGAIDLDEERARLGREMKSLQDLIARIDGKLANEKFISRAPAHVVEGERSRKAETEATHAKLAEALARLEGV